MSKKIVVILSLVALVFCTERANAQQLKWGLRFDTRFDNQEYSAVTQEGVISSKTDFSVRLAPVVGIAIDRLHSIMGGASFTFDMGAPHDKRDPEVLLYYNYRTPKFSAYAGKFERRRLVGGYSRAIYAESHTFYDHVIEGFAFQYTPDASKFELVLDWDGMQSPQKRESFRIISAGEWNPTKIASTKWFTAGYSFDMYHLASSAEQSEGVVDHILMNPYVGAVFNRLSNVWFQRLELSVGWLGSFDRERRVENVWEAANGLTVDFTLQKWNVGIHNHLYLGDKQFAYWDKYGSRVYRGDPFYSISGTYNYTRIYWRPRLSEGVSFDLSLEFPYDGSNMGFQQIAWIGVSIDSGVFDRKRKK